MTSQPTGPRFALYYTPAPEHPLGRAAAQWLGRNPFTRAETLRDDRLNSLVSLTTEPRRYGFHATLKAPFYLAPGTSLQELENAVRRFTSSRPPCPIGPMRIGTLRGFFAIMPRVKAPFVQGFAAQVVSQFDRFRAPMTAEDLRRRLGADLDDTR